MKRMRIAAVLLGLATIFSLAGCSGGGEAAGPASGEDSLLLESEELGFSAELPPLLEGRTEVEESRREAYGETVTTLSVYYVNGEARTHVLSFEEMSAGVWGKIQAEGGPLGRMLGVSDSGRVVVLNTLQSNPFPEGTEDYLLFQDLPQQLSVIEESFRFLGEEAS